MRLSASAVSKLYTPDAVSVRSPSSRTAPKSPPKMGKDALAFKRMLHYDKFADARSITEKMRKHVTITFQVR